MHASSQPSPVKGTPAYLELLDHLVRQRLLHGFSASRHSAVQQVRRYREDVVSHVVVGALEQLPNLLAEELQVVFHVVKLQAHQQRLTTCDSWSVWGARMATKWPPIVIS